MSRQRDAEIKFSGYAMILEEVGRALGVSRERVRQIESKALRKARLVLARLGYSLEDLIGEGDHHG